MRKRYIVIIVLLLVILSIPAVYGRFRVVQNQKTEAEDSQTEEASEDDLLTAVSDSEVRTESEDEGTILSSSAGTGERTEGSDSASVKADGNETVETVETAENVSIEETDEKGIRKVVLQDPENEASLVRFYIWSETNSQDDLIVYDGTENEDGNWEAVFDVTEHKHPGTYLVHTYVNGEFIGAAEFDLPYEEMETTYTAIAAGLEAAKTNQQLILVQAEGTEATLSMLNKESDGNWVEILRTHAFVGENGVGETSEWSHTTPPGIFSFGMAFGILPDPGTVFSYVQLDENDYWVDDVDSEYYNQYVSTDTVEMTWASAEHLIEHDPSYNYALSIDYNPDCIPGEGSAIFLHCINVSTTLGCVAVSEDAMKEILQNVRLDCRIIIDNGDEILKY